MTPSDGNVGKLASRLMDRVPLYNRKWLTTGLVGAIFFSCFLLPGFAGSPMVLLGIAGLFLFVFCSLFFLIRFWETKKLQRIIECPSSVHWTCNASEWNAFVRRQRAGLNSQQMMSSATLLYSSLGLGALLSIMALVSFLNIDGIESWALVAVPTVAFVMGFSAMYVGLGLRGIRLRMQIKRFEKYPGELWLGRQGYFLNSLFVPFTKAEVRDIKLNGDQEDDWLEFFLVRSSGFYSSNTGKIGSSGVYCFEVPVPKDKLTIASQWIESSQLK